MAEVLAFIERHPVWSFAALLVVACTVVAVFDAIARAVRRG